MKIRDFLRGNEKVSTTTAPEISEAVKQQVTCNDDELKSFISQWLEKEEWTFEEFPKFIASVGMEMPIQLSNFDKPGNCFDCKTTMGDRYTITLKDAPVFERAEMWIKSISRGAYHDRGNEVTSVFQINSNYKKGTIPKAKYVGTLRNHKGHDEFWSFEEAL